MGSRSDDPPTLERHVSSGSQSSTGSFDDDGNRIGSRSAPRGYEGDEERGEEHGRLPVRPPNGGMPYNDAAAVISKANTRSILTALEELGLLNQARAKPEALGVTGHDLASGLEMISSGWTPAHTARAGVASKNKRGDTELDRLKTKQVVVKPIPGGLGVSKTMQVLTLNNPVESFKLFVTCSMATTWSPAS